MLASTTSCRLNKLHMRRFSKAHCCEVFAASSRTHPGRQQAHREESTAIWASEARKPQQPSVAGEGLNQQPCKRQSAPATSRAAATINFQSILHSVLFQCARCSKRRTAAGFFPSHNTDNPQKANGKSQGEILAVPVLIPVIVFYLLLSFRGDWREDFMKKRMGLLVLSLWGCISVYFSPSLNLSQTHTHTHL